ncbi:MAG: hypothetical protein R3F61_22640 [Myxococcota bacterium]
MQHTVVGHPLAWSRDFALLGIALGGAAPFFVIFDFSFAFVGALVGGTSGALLGALSAVVVELARTRVPMSVQIAGMAAVGSLWGALAGVAGGASGTMFHEGGIVLGFVVGGCTGMVALGLFFPVYLFLSVRRDPVWPAVAAALLAAPMMGWLGIAALGASLFGLWLFALPVAMWSAVALDRSVERARLAMQVSDARRERLAPL